MLQAQAKSQMGRIKDMNQRIGDMTKEMEARCARDDTPKCRDRYVRQLAAYQRMLKT